MKRIVGTIVRWITGSKKPKGSGIRSFNAERYRKKVKDLARLPLGWMSKEELDRNSRRAEKSLIKIDEALASVEGS